ncbi:MAG: hypothetical protein ACJ746_03755 [Bryobacteraceae bacterium]
MPFYFEEIVEHLGLEDEEAKTARRKLKNKVGLAEIVVEEWTAAAQVPSYIDALLNLIKRSRLSYRWLASYIRMEIRRDRPAFCKRSPCQLGGSAAFWNVTKVRFVGLIGNCYVAVDLRRVAYQLLQVGDRRLAGDTLHNVMIRFPDNLPAVDSAFRLSDISASLLAEFLDDESACLLEGFAHLASVSVSISSPLSGRERGLVNRVWWSLPNRLSWTPTVPEPGSRRARIRLVSHSGCDCVADSARSVEA